MGQDDASGYFPLETGVGGADGGAGNGFKKMG